ncbi:glycosyltransferase family 4 protein [Methylobacterium nonmethylotrophicum]|uniref:Glycosyl transferase family 1 n=1 Tax=Methylobacterium nonmethylotrophicum TaxID=1141884 RepID=A0A4Z0NJ50_9HYPH|nr:glycosyltransferase family 4 protein [Methylobacterium nonmethylotrophicum]TGD95713.1 glycosyl transferase family 1 [Methylobacterium nonmethylotrophicum]
MSLPDPLAPGLDLSPERARQLRADIARNLAEFRSLLAHARAAAASGRTEAAVVLCEAAAAFAISNHCGLFSSPELEGLIAQLGAEAGATDMARRGPPRSPPREILHVCTQAVTVGGGTRLVWRWIGRDVTRRHSVALTRQAGHPLPPDLVAAVRASGGEIHILDPAGGLVARARRLAAIGREADLVVAHTERDVVPLLAFADPARSPPMLLDDLGDHKFRLGLSASTAVASLRESGMRLAHRRRDVEPERSVLLPIPVDPVVRRRSREEARRLLGLPAGGRVLLCIARGAKFKTLGTESYADLHLPVLAADPGAILVVVGAGARPDWRAASEQVGGRILSLEERPDTAAFYEAADIYVDSFPFVSITSLLEAAGYALPLVSLFPHPDTAEIFGADMPGLAGCLQRAGSRAAYHAALSGLLADEPRRRALGARTRASVAALHAGPRWLEALGHAYAVAARLHGRARTFRRDDAPTCEAVDLMVPLVCQQGHRPARAIAEQARIYPLAERVRLWHALSREAGPCTLLSQGTAACFLPDPALLWLKRARQVLRRPGRPVPAG